MKRTVLYSERTEQGVEHTLSDISWGHERWTIKCFTALCMRMNDRKSTTGIDLGVTNKF